MSKPLCLNCDNRHGCRSDEPLCLTLARAPEETRLSGRALMERRGLLDECPCCAHFRGCWSLEAWRAARRRAEARPDSPTARGPSAARRAQMPGSKPNRPEA